MEHAEFDRWVRGFGSRLSRRTLSVAAASTFMVFGRILETEARKKKKGKKKKKKANASPPPPPPLPYTCDGVEVWHHCGHDGCQCREGSDSRLHCLQYSYPPGTDFIDCGSNDDCPTGQVCDSWADICMTVCTP